MKTFKKYFIITLITLSVLLSVGVGLIIEFFGGGFAPSYNKAVKILNKDVEILNSINKMLLGSEDTYFYWFCTDEGIIEAGETKYSEEKEHISERYPEKLQKDLSILEDKDYISVRKCDDYIEYQLWLSWGGSAYLIYSPDSPPDKQKTQYDSVFELREIEGTDWYYFKIVSEL